MGGYGVMGVCNDSAGLIDFAIRGKTDVFPLISTGRFLFHLAERLTRMEKVFSDISSLRTTIKDIQELVSASCRLPSDLHSSPQNVQDAARRFLVCNPSPSFQLTADSIKELKDLSRKYAAYC